jgi:HlyD family secretion protein
MHRLRNTIVVLVLLVAVALIGLAISHRGDASAVPVPMQRLAYTTFVVKLPENGVVMRPSTVTVPTLIGGNIGAIYVKAGDAVTAGQLLATIENPTVTYDAEGSKADYSSSVANVRVATINEQNARVEYQGQVDTAKSALAEARRVYDSDVALLAQRAIARNQVDADRAKLDQAQAAYDQALRQLRIGAVSGYGVDSVQYAKAAAEKSRILNEENQQQLSYTRIVAPSSGIIQTVASEPNDPLRSVQPGDPISAGQALFTMSSANRYVVKAQVDEQDIINVHVGQRAVVSGQDFGNNTIPGHVSYIAPVAIKSTDTSSTAKQVLTTISLERSPSFLKDGMTADVDIYTAHVPHAIVVPNDAVTKESGNSYVYVVENGVARKRRVKVGRIGDTSTLVASGLAPGETIVTRADTQIKDGTTVTPMPSVSPAASPS